MNAPVDLAQTLDEPPYLSGFGNTFESEALPAALPIGRNSPQRCPYGLYAEQLSGSAFTAPRATNKRSWLYRIQPSVHHWGAFKKADLPLWKTAPNREVELSPQPLRWSPVPIPDQPLSFIEGVRTITTCGDAAQGSGMAAHIYLANRSMSDEVFYNADGEMLVVPQEGRLKFVTELGVLMARPGEVVVIPRGVKFRVELLDAAARGYICENYGQLLTLPERGPIGANCLANPRDFLAPTAAFEDRAGPCQLSIKWGGSLWTAQIDHSPLDVVAWHGDYAPYKYDLNRYSPVGSILFDHADPSIYTVMTSTSDTAGTANVDFVIFPERWSVAEDTFRPPWYHMNVMSEFMGLIYGAYDAKPTGFSPGAMSLHNCMLPHGPDRDAFVHASQAELKPVRMSGSLAFMFETRLPQTVTAYAAGLSELQQDYGRYGATLPRLFDPTKR